MGAALVAMDKPFSWGVADCCTSACDAFRDLHGIDPMAPLRGRYHTATGAARAIAARGGFDAMAADLAAAAGLLPGRGAPGEIGVVHGPTGPALVLGIGRGLWMQKTEFGLTSVGGAVMCWGVD